MAEPKGVDGRSRPGLTIPWHLLKLVPLTIMAIVAVVALAERALFDRIAYLAGVSWGQLPFFDAYTPLSWFECMERGVDITVANPCDTRSHLKFPMSYPPAWLWLNFDGLGTVHTDTVGLVWGALMLVSLAFLPVPNTVSGAVAFLLGTMSHATFFALYQANFDIVVFAGLVLASRLAICGGAWRAGAYVGLALFAMLKIRGGAVSRYSVSVPISGSPAG